jgi:hypothetical protein
MDKMGEEWKCCGKVPKQEVVFLAQVILIYSIVIVSIINLSLGNGDSNLWCVLISFSAGSLLPSPQPYKLLNKTKKVGSINTLDRLDPIASVETIV